MSHASGLFQQQSLVLDRLQFMAREEIGPAVAESLELDYVKDLATQHLLLTLKAEVLAERLPPEKVTHDQDVTFHSPANPWQHFKVRFMPRWFVQRWPTKLHSEVRTYRLEVDLQRFRRYPKADYVLPPSFGDPVLSHTHIRRCWEVQ